ncbi:MAG: hypothetical protein KGL39_25585 [Patescibacteria group bacterium]|nr:hypothetical protein [Patescibacteria group bacterium]
MPLARAGRHVAEQALPEDDSDADEDRVSAIELLATIEEEAIWALERI